MKYRVIGASKETGEDIELTIEAATPSAAQAKANEMGVAVECVERVQVPASPPSSPQPAAGPTDDLRRLAEAAERASYRPSMTVRPVPDVQTIQKTGKPFKLGMLIGATMMLASLVGCLVSSSTAFESVKA